MVEAPVGRVRKARPVPFVTIMELEAPVPKVPALLVLVKLKLPNAIFPSVKTRPAALDTVTFCPNVNVALVLFMVIPVKAKGLVGLNRLPVIVPVPPTEIGPVEVKVPAPKLIGPFKFNPLPPIAVTPAAELYVPPTVSVVPIVAVVPVRFNV